MSNFKYITKGNFSFERKPKLYFTCHPEDFNKLEKITEDIFKVVDCVIYYTEDMNEVVDKADIESVNLLVVPVTWKLLSMPCRAMDDVSFARETNITILPLMFEDGLDFVYSLPNKFGELQYLKPFSSDLTEVPYEEKLRKYLGAVLVSKEEAERIRNAFDAYIFLSYRKKDRQYANELMRLIHLNPKYRDIAIWYDEFLAPGESFSTNIDKALEESKLFVLLVTPCILEDPNYVMRVEYPEAVKRGCPIFSVEMVETDRTILEEKYPNIPLCITTSDIEAFNHKLGESLKGISNEDNDDDAEHNYLIGLAYLDGIDVEINRDLALSLITTSAEKGVVDAMAKLFNLYYYGAQVKLDYRKALYWAEKLAKHNLDHFGEENADTLLSLNNLAYIYNELGRQEDAINVSQKVYDVRCKLLGEEHPYTIIALNNLAAAYLKQGRIAEGIEANKKAYSLNCRVLGEEHPSTILSLNNLATVYSEMGRYDDALRICQQVYALHSKVLGEDHPTTLLSLNNLAHVFGKLGKYADALRANTVVYALRRKTLGDLHPDTIASLNNIATIYLYLGRYDDAEKASKMAYASFCKVLGEEHPSTLISLANLAYAYGGLGRYAEALELNKRTYELFCKTLGAEHPSTLLSLNNLAHNLDELCKYEEAVSSYKKAYEISCKVLGKNHPNTLLSLSNLACTYSNLGRKEEAEEINKKVYRARCQTLGEEHPDTLATLTNLAGVYVQRGNNEEALKVFKKLYELNCKVYGEENPNTLQVANNLAFLYNYFEEFDNALRIYQSLYKAYLKLLGDNHPLTARISGKIEELKNKR